MELKIEVACFDLKSALIAASEGADRIEFCSDYASGGITPSESDIQTLRSQIRIPLHVIIRPRPGNFIYASWEIEQMKKSIVFCRENGVDGIVLGALNAEKEVDRNALNLLLENVGAMSVTFHRAIDDCFRLEKAIEILIYSGVQRVLSSGKATTALQGIATLKEMQKMAGKNLTVMPGGGLRSSNVEQFIKEGFKELHTAAITNPSEGINREELKKIISLKRQHV